MLTRYAALVSETDQVPFSQLAEIASALQKQATRDFAPIWQISATISVFQSLQQVPSDYWPIIIRDDIDQPGAAGYHTDSSGQPYALVQASENVSLTCSHELMEMLGDPFGNRLVAADSLKAGQGRVNYLVEVCDPSEGEQFAYSINGIRVSDFYTPNFFDPVLAPSVRYSFTGCIRKPRQILEGGYISWMIPATREWWQAFVRDGAMTFRSLGILERNGRSWRETVDTLTFEPLAKLMGGRIGHEKMLAASFAAPSSLEANSGRADQIHRDIDKLLSGLPGK